MDCGEALDFGTVSKHPDERLILEFNFFNQLADFWEPGEVVRIGDARRPLSPTGFVNIAQNDGTSNNREPRWTREDGGITKDGSIQWLAVPATNQAIDLILAAVAVPTSGLSVPIVPEWDGAIAYVTIDGGGDGADYPLECKVSTQRGATLVGVVDVHVRKRRSDTCSS
jgi:hypothetical protein